MKLKAITIILVAAAACVVPANAAIDPTNPDWIIYRDPFGDTTAELYDQYMEVTQGESFTLHVVVNRDAPAGLGWQVRAYIHAFWYDYTVVQNHPVPNYTYSSMSSMYNPPAPQIATWNGYVQLTNDSWSVRSMWEMPAETPYVVMSWDFTILPNAPLGLMTMPMRFRTYDINGTQQSANSVETDPAFTINVLKAWDPGDLDHDEDIDADDLDLMGDYIRTGTDPNPGVGANYDLSADGSSSGTDGTIDLLDLDYLVHELVETIVGTGSEYADFNLDGLVDTTDLTRLATNYGTGSTWTEGNANRNVDLVIDTTDLTNLATYFGFIAPDVIPEPMTLSLLAVGACVPLFRRKRR